MSPANSPFFMSVSFGVCFILLDIQVSFKDCLAFPNINACMNVISIMNIPAIPKSVAKPVVLSPKMFPSTIKKTAVTHKKTPNAIDP